jgi:hypothetical protein
MPGSHPASSTRAPLCPLQSELALCAPHTLDLLSSCGTTGPQQVSADDGQAEVTPDTS